MPDTRLPLPLDALDPNPRPAQHGHSALPSCDVEQHYRTLFEVCGVGLSEADPADGTIVRANRHLAQMLGCEPAALVGRRFVDITHPADRDANWDAFVRLVKGEVPSLRYEKRLLRHDGEPLWVLISVNVIRSAQPVPRVVAAVIDIGAQKRAQARLAESEQRLQLALAASSLGLWEWDLASGRLWYSDRVLEITGLTQAQLVADPGAARRLVHPDDVHVIRASDEAARTGRAFHAEYRILRHDGTLRWVANHARTECDEHGVPQRMVGTLTDITDRKQGEEALRQAHDELEARVHERTEALARANTTLANEVAARRATEAHVRELLGQLVNAEEEERRRIARELHDTVGQHLTALTLGLKAVEEEPALPARLRSRMAQLRHATRALDDDIDRLSHELRPAALDDLGLDDALRQHASGWAGDSGIVVDLHTHGLRGRRFAQAVESTVYRVVQEALTNVRKHAGASRVSLIAEVRDQALRVIVEDDGSGLASAPAASPGSGVMRRRLGLRGMSERAMLAGGRLDVESEPGRGTTLYLTIPLSEED
ncbi:PAS domain S-box protein [Ideonella sp. BN130291]|uniref:PAS domain S-box protein n=1 Tax=Ideonella sp. BN130291 TaxID=3112940 RepID=UPI002E253A75|nr:PAS domain S-box protein [Ideonella sp. BN130291]